MKHKSVRHNLHSVRVGRRVVSVVGQFISSRRIRFDVDGVFSNWFNIVSGVPIGMILDPCFCCPRLT